MFLEVGFRLGFIPLKLDSSRCFFDHYTMLSVLTSIKYSLYLHYHVFSDSGNGRTVISISPISIIIGLAEVTTQYR